MHIIAKGAIVYYCDHFPIAKTALLTWYHQFSKQVFNDFNELKAIYGHASIVANNRVIFNIKGNDFRLIIKLNFQKASAYIIWFGTHQAYNKIDSANIPFDLKILEYKKK
jgi:mRNA interferase HigB